MTVDRGFWSARRVLLTGHTGFKGSWMSLWLQMMGCDLYGLAKTPSTTPSMFGLLALDRGMTSVIGDVTDQGLVEQVVRDVKPEIVIHMAAQPLVRQSYSDPVETYATNVMGTVNLLSAMRSQSSAKVFLNVTTDKCYENREWNWGYREIDGLGGHDPYSSSKACSELITSSFRKSFFYQRDSLAVASARAGNVIGGGDWSTDRLIPDVLRAFRRGEVAKIRHPTATRPWQHVLDPLSGYLRLIERLFSGGSVYRDAWNFGPNDGGIKPVEYLVSYLATNWPGGGSWSVDAEEKVHEANLLKLDISKARDVLDWSPRMSLKQTLDSILGWEKRYHDSKDLEGESINQIENFIRIGDQSP